MASCLTFLKARHSGTHLLFGTRLGVSFGAPKGVSSKRMGYQNDEFVKF